MSESRQSIISVALVCLVVALQSGCALAPAQEIPQQTGRVLDAETQQPIEGAIVVLRWQGIGNKTFVDTQTVCYHVESAVTDANGRYATPPWKEESRYRDLSMKEILQTAYKPGYRQVRVDKATGTQYLQRDVGSVEKRLEYLRWLSGYSGCSSAGGSQRHLYPLRASIYYEAKPLSATPERLQWLREVAAGSAVAASRDVTGPERDQAVKEFLKENLK